MQQSEFGGRNIRGLSADHERHGVAMQFEIGSGNAGGQRLLKAPQHGPDAGCEFASPERFGNVIVRAKIQAANAILLTSARGQENNRDARKVTAFANLAADFKTAVAGNHDVEQKENRRLLTRLGQYFVTRNTKAHTKPSRLQVVADQVANVRVVFKNNDVLLQWGQDVRITILTATPAQVAINVLFVRAHEGC